jgi:hypothetical protein
MVGTDIASNFFDLGFLQSLAQSYSMYILSLAAVLAII